MLNNDVHLGYFFDSEGMKQAKEAQKGGLTVVDPLGNPCRKSAPAHQKEATNSKPRKLPRPPRRDRKYGEELKSLKVSLERTLRSRKRLSVCLVLFALSQMGLLYALNEAKSSSEQQVKRLQKEISDLTYVSSFLIKEVKAKRSGGVPKSNPDTVTVMVDVVNLRSAPAMDAAVVSKVTRGNSLLLIERNAEWVKVINDKGAIAWARSELFS